MANDLKPCPWCGSTKVDIDFMADIHTHRHYSVYCSPCDRSVEGCGDEESAIDSWNALPRHPQWTTYTGEENTIPPILAAIIVEDGEAKFACRHSADGECYQGVDDNYTLRVGAKWMPWPGGE